MRVACGLIRQRSTVALANMPRNTLRLDSGMGAQLARKANHSKDLFNY